MRHLQRQRLNRAHASFHQAAQAVLNDPSDFRRECATRTHDVQRLKQQPEEQAVIGLIIRRDQH